MVGSSVSARTDAPDRFDGKTIALISSLLACMLLAALDQNVVTTALPTIAGKLGGIQQISWAVTAYLLAMMAATPLYGKLSDVYGGKRLLMAAITIFVIGSLAAGASQNMGELSATRAIQGVGSGGVIAMTFSIRSSVIPPRQAGRYQGYNGLVWTLATLTGPLIGGYLAEHGLWRWIFFLNVPVGVAALAVTAVFLRLSSSRRPRRVDYLGACLLVAASACLLLVTVWGGQRYAWASAQTVVLVTATAVFTVAFVTRELSVREPLLTLRLLRDPVVAVSVATTFLVGVAMFAVVLFLPLYLQVVAGIPAGTSGLYLLPLWVAVTASSFATGRAVYRTGRYKGVIVAGAALIALGIFLFTYAGAGTSIWVILGVEVVFGLGLGGVISKFIMTMQNSVMRADMGTAISAMHFFRELGGSLGAAIFGAIFAARLGYWRQRLLPSGPGISSLRLKEDLLRLNPALADQLRTAAPGLFRELARVVALSLRPVFLVAVPIAAVAFLLTWLLRQRPLRGESWESSAGSEVGTSGQGG